MLDEALAIFLEPQHQALARLLVAFSCFLRERRIDQGEIALDGQQASTSSNQRSTSASSRGISRTWTKGKASISNRLLAGAFMGGLLRGGKAEE